MIVAPPTSCAATELHSGLLTFTLYYLCKNPEAMRKLREEVDEVLGDEPVRLDHIAKLKYTSGAHPLFTPPLPVHLARGAMLTSAGPRD